MPSSKRSKFRLTLTSLQICRSKQTASLATCPLPKSLVFSPFNHKSVEISYPNLQEPPPSTPTDLSGIWDAPSNSTTGSLAERKPINFKTSCSRFKKEENINKEKLKATEDRCPSSEETSWSSVEANEETESLVSSHPSSNSSMDDKKSKNCNSSNKSGLEQVTPCMEDGKVDESYVVLKRSKSPTDDFKKSMMEMIVEKQMSGIDELEHLLSCFLSLNSRQHHAAIVTAFTEVVCLSATSLLTNNRFICDVCNKGFRRDQNLQLHRRRHNLPWNLNKKASKEAMNKKRVYVCPDTNCIHHNPTRALGDLSGLRKHYNRKHGEKKFNCQTCSKKYGLLSDFILHTKTCSTQEHRCACGLIFTRRNSFLTHKAICEALTKELNNEENVGNSDKSEKMQVKAKSSPIMYIKCSESAENGIGHSHHQPKITTWADEATANFSHNAGVYASIHAPPISTFQYPGLLRALLVSDTHPVYPMMISQFYLSSNITPSYPAAPQEHYTHYSSSQLPALSETALLHKAAQIGPTSSDLLPLQNLGCSDSSLFNHQNNNETPISGFNSLPPPLWNNPDELEDISEESGLEMELHNHTNASISPNNFLMDSSSLFTNNVNSNDFMIGPSAMFSDNPTTPDNLLGLTIGAPEEAFASDGLSSLFGSM